MSNASNSSWHETFFKFLVLVFPFACLNVKEYCACFQRFSNLFTRGIHCTGETYGIVLRIRNFIPDPDFSIPDPWKNAPAKLPIDKNLSMFNPKNFNEALGNKIRDVYPWSRIPHPDFFHPGSGGRKSTGSRIWIRNTEFLWVLLVRWCFFYLFRLQ